MKSRISARVLFALAMTATPAATAFGADELAFPDPSVPATPEVQTASAVKPILVEGETEVVRERYDDGAIKVEREVGLDEEHNFINHGSWTSWDRDGNMTGRGEFRMGVPHGQWVRWHESGAGKLFADPLYQGFKPPFRSELTLAEGLLHGAWRILDADDRLASEWNFVAGLRGGDSLWYAANGTVARKVVFRDGQLDGEAIDYGPDGEVVHRALFVSGHELVKDMKVSPEGEKLHEGWVLKSRRIIEPKYDWWNAHVTSEKATDAGAVRHGKWVFWHPNGARKTEGEYDQGRRSGEWTWWYENGQQRTVGAYLEDQPHGRWAWWRSNGIRQCSGMFDKGDETGVWSTWDPQGRLIQISDYSAPKAVPAAEDVAPLEVATVPEPVEEVPAPDLTALREQIGGGDVIVR